MERLTPPTWTRTSHHSSSSLPNPSKLGPLGPCGDQAPPPLPVPTGGQPHPPCIKGIRDLDQLVPSSSSLSSSSKLLLIIIFKWDDLCILFCLLPSACSLLLLPFLSLLRKSLTGENTPTHHISSKNTISSAEASSLFLLNCKSTAAISMKYKTSYTATGKKCLSLTFSFQTRCHAAPCASPDSFNTKDPSGSNYLTCKISNLQPSQICISL